VRSHYHWSIGLLAVVPAVLLAGCGKQPQPAEVRAVRSMVISEGAAGDAMTFTAEIHSRYESDLAFQVAGKIVARPVDAGTVVRRGAVLARIDEQDLRVGVDAAQSAVTAAQAQFDRARSDEARFRDLLERGLATRSNFLAQQTSVRTAQSQLEQARSELQLRRQQNGYGTLRADRDGVVTRVYQNVGAVVGAGQAVVALAQPAQLEAVFDVAESQVDQVRSAESVEVRALSAPATAITAQVREVAPSADPLTRTYRVRASLPVQATNLKLGMIVAATVHAVVSDPTLTSVPATAIFQKDGKPALWIVGDKLVLELRSVIVQRYDSDRVLIASGVRRGERVVTAGVHKLAPGATVRLLEQP
jgi:RND family efflux transporter MFP subunit